ncbi:MAG: 3-phosphoglycerate dehydrogenase [Chloroflexi bacterium]|nr:3-phosphoglycerate dehydrogenase [Chloroflexota bacterium]
MMRALILAPFSPAFLEKLRQSIEVTYESWLETRRLYDPDELALRLNNEQIDVLVIESDFVFEEMFEQAASLRFVGICRSATNHVDIEAATRHGVAVVNTPSRNAQAVAEHALGLMLSLARKIPAAHRYVAEGRWQNPVEPYLSMRGVELAGRTLGIVGLGAIGRRLAAICAAIGMTVVAYDPYVDAAPPNVTLKSLDELLAESDFVSVHVPLTDETEAMLDSRRLALMKPSAFLINATDASVVDQDALVEALRDKRIGGAAFDVFETHPVTPHHPLLTLDNVVLTPHLGGATEETIERHSQMMTSDILRFLRNERPEHLVNPEVWEQRG